jgi:hypothetical protein
MIGRSIAILAHEWAANSLLSSVRRNPQIPEWVFSGPENGDPEENIVATFAPPSLDVFPRGSQRSHVVLIRATLPTSDAFSGHSRLL